MEKGHAQQGRTAGRRCGVRGVVEDAVFGTRVRRRILVPLLGLLLPLGCGGRGEDTRPRPEFVLLVSIDTLRADRLSCYGHDRLTSPHLDELAKEGVLFENAFSQSAQTLTSHKSLFASKYPLTLVAEETNADLNTLAALEDPLPFTVDCFASVRETLMSAVQGAGYRTAAFTDGGYVTAEVGFGPGYDHFNDEAGGFASVLTRANEWLTEHLDDGDPKLLFVHGYDVHCPYWQRAPYNEKFLGDTESAIDFEFACGKGGLAERELSPADLAALRAHYDGGVASVDDYLGQLLARLRELALWDEALVVVFSDHGESLGEHGQVGHGGLYYEQLHVPLIVKFPAAWGVRPARIREAVELVDVMPTVLDVLGLEAPAGIDGRSVLPILRRGAEGRRYVIGQTTFQEGRRAAGGPVRYLTNPAVRSILEPGRWHLVHDARADASEIFALDRDPRAEHDLSAEVPEELTTLLEALGAYDRGDSAAGFRPPDGANLSRELRDHLRGIGY